MASGAFEAGIDEFSNIIAGGLEKINVNEILQSLIVDGIINGVGSVLSFLPIIVILFFFYPFWRIQGIWQEWHL